jgi:hypothetical protein
MDTFEVWMKRVDSCFIKLTGLGRDDWPDQCYWDMWDEELDPIEAVIQTIEGEYGAEGLKAFNIKVS